MKKNKFYYLDGSVLDHYIYNKKLHRLGGPAIELVSGYKSWWVEGKRHRLDGPAIAGVKDNEYWYIDDEQLTEEQFEGHHKRVSYLKKNKSCDSNCEHDYINVGFMNVIMACKHCGKDYEK